MPILAAKRMAAEAADVIAAVLSDSRHRFTKAVARKFDRTKPDDWQYFLQPGPALKWKTQFLGRYPVLLVTAARTEAGRAALTRFYTGRTGDAEEPSSMTCELPRCATTD